jgi:ABC-type multidrug transport system fused ATPase/permease subunit
VNGLRAWWADYRVALDATRARGPLASMFVLMLFAALLDLFGIGLVAPFVGLVMGQGSEGLPAPLRELAGTVSIEGLGLAIVAVFVAKSVVAYRMQRRIVRFAEAHRARLMTRLLQAALARPYVEHLRKPTTAHLNTLFWHTAQYAGSTLAGSLRLLTDFVVLAAVVLLLLGIDPVATALLAVFLGSVVVGTGALVRHELARSARAVADGQARALGVVQDSLGAFREIRILGAEQAFEAALAQAARGLADATARQNAIHQVPRAAVETALVVFLVAVSLYALRSGPDAGALLPVLGAMGVAAMRLLPIATSLLSGVNNLRASRLALAEVAAALRAAPRVDLGSAAPPPAAAWTSLALEGIGFRYPGASEDALSDLSLALRRGEILGIAGRSGAGKSTLVDLLLGLLAPTAGTIRADGMATALDHPDWQGRCAYIPQDVFLVAGSLRDNILFGDVEDAPRLARAVRLARLDELVQRLERGLDTPIGERGVGLSGGQRQRVAIARALYRERGLLVMDEATSALDARTEAELVATLQSLRGQCTVIVVAHRPALLDACDRTVELAGGRVQAAAETEA